MEWLAVVHSVLRWILLAVAAWGAFRALTTLRAGVAPAPGDAALGKAFTGLIDLQWIVGAATWLALLGGSTLGIVLAHAAVMTTAVVAAHVGRARTRKRGGAEASRAALWGYVAPLVLIALGHLVIPGHVK